MSANNYHPASGQSHSHQAIPDKQVLSTCFLKPTLQKWFSGWSFPYFNSTPRNSFVMSTQTDKAGEGRNLWHSPLEWLPESLLFLPYRQSLRPAQESQSPSASLYPCHTCSTRGISASCDPSCPPWDSVGQCADHQSSGALPGWLAAV